MLKGYVLDSADYGYVLVAEYCGNYKVPESGQFPKDLWEFDF